MREQNIGVKWFNTVFYPQKRTGRAVRYEDGVLPRLHEPQVTLFTPWGPRYSWGKRGEVIQTGDKELDVLYFLAELMSEMKQNMPDTNFRWVFLGADLYGTRINNLPIEVVSNYFDSFAQWLNVILPEAEFQIWSRSDVEAEQFRQEIRSKFDNFVSHELLARATKTAQAMGRNSSARDYIVERIAEAILIERTLKPIKLSCVARCKDDDVDWMLPRLYLLPERLHAPWL